ncbi:rab-GTPase-TBC domain-containing protein [Bisporella sp. PMI_857]|nr:rab-GTPase-TBC domain-containing protein [Bisporella sp. PMI_857]
MDVVNGMSIAPAMPLPDHQSSHSDAQIQRLRSRKYSLNHPTTRPQTANPTTSSSPPPSSSNDHAASSPLPSPTSSSSISSKSSAPLPQRKDSLLHRQSRRPQTSHHPPSHEPPRSFTSPPQLQQSIRKRPSEASRLRALNNGYRSQSSDGRQTPDSILENFSRPRQPSLRRRNESPKPLHPTFPLHSHDEERTPTYDSVARDRGLSTSSVQSINYSVPIPLRPSNSIPDYHAAESIYTRQRNLNSSAYRPDRGMSRPDSNYSAHRREPITRPAGFDDEEVRASFRSALTTNSSFLGTSGTERSSVLTKSSSATSVFGKDEGMSVDDLLGMYEGGFTDSGVDDTRPTTANSEQLRISALCEAMNDTLMVPGSNITIRDSAAIFRNSSINSAMESSAEATPISPQGLQNQDAYFDRRPAASRPMTGAGRVDLEFDATRDRYGFRKKNQHISLEQYDAWNGPYTEYLSRRRKKWVALLKENGLMTDHPNRFPPKSAKIKRFVRKGIPPDWRGDAWFYYAGGPAMLSKHYGIYDELTEKAAAGGVSETDDEIIERDLHRTFPDNVRFKHDPVVSPSGPDVPEPETPILQSLRRVLQAFAIYNPRIGYCQSLNFLAGLLLLFMDEEKSFWMLNIITRIYLPGTHEVNLEGANVDLGVLMMSIKETMPSVWAKIGGELDGSPSDPKVSMRLPPITLCTTAWFMSCFIGTLPIETVLRVWDSFFYEGSKTLFRIALTIFKLGETEIKAVTDPMEIFQVVQTIPRRLLDANLVVESCYRRRGGFGGLSQEKIEVRRAERRRGYAEERAAANGEISVVKRKATVFGRRKVREAVMV